MDAASMLKYIDKNIIGVVPTFSITFTGKFELVQPLGNTLDDLQKRTGLDIDIHVDGASGGFLAPLSAPDIRVGLPPATRQVDQHLRP